MASKSFFKVNAVIRKPTQQQIEQVRKRALADIKHSRGANQKLDAKAVEAMLRIVTGRYSDLMSSLESEHRKVDHKLDAKFAQGFKQAKTLLIKIEQDVRYLNDMGYETKSSGIDYPEAVARLKRTVRREEAKKGNQK